MTKRLKKPIDPDADLPIVIENFHRPSKYDLDHPNWREPRSINGSVTVRRYRITIELVDEPLEVIQERIRKLWRECDNYHQWDALKAEAKRYGLILDREEIGADAKRGG